MAQQTINVGAAPNDGTGTPLRTAFQYTNSNFSELYTAVGPSGNNIVVPGTATITSDLTVGANITSTSGKFATTASGQNVGLQLDSYVSGAAFNNYILNNDSTAGTIAALNFGRNTSLLYGFIRTNNNSQNLQLGTSGAGSVEFFQNNSTAMTLNATGLGIGASPATKLDVAGNAALTGTSGFKYLYFNLATDTNSVRGAKIGKNYDSPFDLNIHATTAASGASNEAAIKFFRNNTDVSMTLDSSGNVGIGVAPATAVANNRKLEIVGTINSAVVLGTNSSNASARNWATASNWNAYGDLAFLQSNALGGDPLASGAGTTRMTLDASGNLLVGTITNTDAFRTNIQFSGTSINGLIVKNLASTGGPLLLQLNDSAQTVNTATTSAEYVDSTTQRWRLYKNGGLANYQANNVNLSDVRTKTDIKPLGSYWNKIKSLEVVTFKYNDQTHSDDNIGLIAQQVEFVAPELVDVDGFGETPVDGVPLKTIYTTDLYHASIKALQEAMFRIEALEAKLA